MNSRNQPSFPSSAWYQALSLIERIASLSSVERNTENSQVDTNLAERRRQRWQSQPPFNTDSYFAQRLAIDGITEEEFIDLLGEPIEAVKNRLPDSPDWLQELADGFANYTDADTSVILPPEQLGEQKEAGFLYAIEPLINQGIDRLKKGIESLIQKQSDVPFDPNTVVRLLFANLPGELLWRLSRTMVLELNVARLQGQLQGNTPEDRFFSFLQRLRDFLRNSFAYRDIALSLLQEYPVLARQVVICIDQWVNFSLEFIQHLCADWEAICTTFTPETAPGVLVQLDTGAGDKHRGGRSVIIATFSSGFQIVYKPKSLAIDVHFQELLTWLNERGNHPPFRTLNVINRYTYGWVEFVRAQPCNSPEAVQRFYQRQGGYLALLYAMEAMDFHYENLIAAGEAPVLVDLESLFHPESEEFDHQKSFVVASKRMVDSVLRVGLLPQRIWANAESEGIDFSGLGGAAGQMTPNPVPSWVGTGTDEMRLTKERMAMPGSQNRPRLNDSEVNVLDYTDAIATGFTEVYQLLLNHRDELLSEHGIVAQFAEDEVRVILRPTQTYGLLLQDSFHPDLLRNALDRDRFFDRLWQEVPRRPNLIKVIPAERDDLWQGDIPMFTTRPNSRHLWRSTHPSIPPFERGARGDKKKLGERLTNPQIADFFTESGMALVQRRLKQLSAEDLTRQLWFIHASLTTLSMDGDRAGWTTYHLKETQTRVTRKQLLAAACRIGDHIETLALRGSEDVTWLGLTLIKARHWTLLPLGMDLYDGIPGIALFLAYLGAIAKEKRYTQLARVALRSIQHQIEESSSLIPSIGGFSGWGGIIYTFTHLSVLWQQPELLAEAEGLLDHFTELIEKDEQFDIIGGAAGCIGSLLSLYHCNPSQRIIDTAIECGDRLLACAQKMTVGIGWMSVSMGKKPLTGFSHGVAGIAWALLELAAVTGEERFQEAAQDAIAYERSLFSSDVGNWPDLREFETTVLSGSPGQVNYMTAWCHGATGIGLARLRSMPHLEDTETRAEIDTALKTTLTQGFGMNHSLCHGDLGNLELLLQASLTLNDPQWQDHLNRLSAMILHSIDEYGWLCGVPLGVETPGLMTGLAGIGYQLLRLAQPEWVPSVLVLEPPTFNHNH
ncbi:type 2 lanthipeptide synthetase LanM family protein [Coleofasciculus sp. G2-EDA-02]|uniref:type 2 lanthipeptide synthetase LanM family protein n=1 Tax=Coleofasciculus sp. G2-EDA-02 TaxID=3069529 RepID=UPI0032FC8A10